MNLSPRLEARGFVKKTMAMAVLPVGSGPHGPATHDPKGPEGFEVPEGPAANYIVAIPVYSPKVDLSVPLFVVCVFVCFRVCV